MRLKTFERATIGAMIVALTLFSLPIKAKNAGSPSAQMRVSKTSSGKTSAPPAAVSRQPQRATSLRQEKQEKAKQDAALKAQLGTIDIEIKKVLNDIEGKKAQEQSVSDGIRNRQDQAGKTQQNLDKAADKVRDMNCAVANC